MLQFQVSEKEEKRYKNTRSLCGRAQIDQKSCLSFFQVANQLNLSVRYCFLLEFFFQIRGVKLSSFRKGGKKYKNTRSLCGEAEIDQKSCTRAKLYVLSSFRKGGKQVKKTSR